jgi:heat shock protein HspQ
MECSAKFFVGQIVHHQKFNYRGVVFDVDATFQGTDDERYESVAQSRPPKHLPWYHVLVAGAEHTTYVAERHLEPDVGRRSCTPLLPSYAASFKTGGTSQERRSSSA